MGIQLGNKIGQHVSLWFVGSIIIIERTSTVLYLLHLHSLHSANGWNYYFFYVVYSDYHRQRDTRLFHHQKAGPNQPVANLVHLFQFAETTELPATKYTQGETTLRHHQQYRIRVILKNEANRTHCVCNNSQQSTFTFISHWESLYFCICLLSFPKPFGYNNHWALWNVFFFTIDVQ